MCDLKMIIGCVVVAICFIGIGFAIYQLIRNEKVYKFRKHIRDELIFNSERWEQKLSIYHKVSYNEMMKRWRVKLRIENFYSSTDCQILINYP